MTECSQETFSFAAHFSRRVEAEFTAGHVSTDGGALLLREVDRGSTCWAGWRAVSAMAATGRSNTSYRRCWRSGFTGWRWAMRT